MLLLKLLARKANTRAELLFERLESTLHLQASTCCCGMKRCVVQTQIDVQLEAREANTRAELATSETQIDVLREARSKR